MIITGLPLLKNVIVFVLEKLYEILEQQILPLYYENHDTWRQVIKNGMRDVRFQFDSNRMVHEYYELLYK